MPYKVLISDSLSKEAVEILTKEKRLKARSQLVRFNATWAPHGTEMMVVMKNTYAMLTQDEFIRLAKLYPAELLENGPKEYLPLTMAIPKLSQQSYLRYIVAKRLREETPS